MDSLQSLSSSRSSSILPASSPSPPSAPTDDDIEAIIQLATSARPSDGWQGPARDTRTQLFVGNLPYRVRWQDLKDLFRKAGTVLRADVSLGPDNRSRGFGTVLLAAVEDAARAIDMFNGYSWQTRILEVRVDRLPSDFEGSFSVSSLAAPASVGNVSHSGPSPNTQIIPVSPIAETQSMQDEHNSLMAGSSNNGGRNLFVGNLPFHCQWQDLKDLFRQAGTIVRADVALSPDGRSRGFGTVSFATEADADYAVQIFNGYEYNGRVLKVHHDRFAANPPPASTSPAPTALSFQPGSSFGTQLVNQQMHIRLPAGYSFDFGPTSGPNSPFDLYPPQPQGPVQSSMSRPPPHHQPETQSLSHHVRDTSMLSARLSGKSPSPDQRSTTPSSRSQSSRPRLHSQSHPAHPGPIALPPPPQPTSFPLIPPHSLSPHGMASTSPMHHPMSTSPLHHPHHQHPHPHQMTPHGLPPITPSMPPFTFLPPHPSPHAPPPNPASIHIPSTLTGMHHVLSPFSPTLTMSPGAFWGRPGGGANPFINTAVGAPVHGTPDGFFDMAQAMGMGPGESMSPRDEPAGYFPPVDCGYFPPMVPGRALGSEGVANEILKDKSAGAGGRRREGREGGDNSTLANGEVNGEGGRALGVRSGSGSSAESLAGQEGDQEARDESDQAEAEKGEDGGLGVPTNLVQRTSSLSSPSRRPFTAQRAGSDPVSGARADKEPVPPKGDLQRTSVTV